MHIKYVRLLYMERSTTVIRLTPAQLLLSRYGPMRLVGGGGGGGGVIMGHV